MFNLVDVILILFFSFLCVGLLFLIAANLLKRLKANACKTGNLLMWAHLTERTNTDKQTEYWSPGLGRYIRTDFNLPTPKGFETAYPQPGIVWDESGGWAGPIVFNDFDRSFKFLNPIRVEEAQHMGQLLKEFKAGSLGPLSTIREM